MAHRHVVSRHDVARLGGPRPKRELHRIAASDAQAVAIAHAQVVLRGGVAGRRQLLEQRRARPVIAAIPKLYGTVEIIEEALVTIIVRQRRIG